MSASSGYAYTGPESLRDVIDRALQQVVDPEVAMNIVDVGLVYAIEAKDDNVRVTMTMTSAACPVADVILDDVRDELAGALPDRIIVDIDLVWEPPWSTERMSERAKTFMGW
jgi:metal-sulfur cluster biosynthetic enzyme